MFLTCFYKRSTHLQTLFIIRCYYSVCLIENGLYAQLLFKIILFIMCINTDKCIIWTVPHILAFKFKCCSLDGLSRRTHQLSLFVLFPHESRLLAHLLPFYASLSTCASFNPPTPFFFFSGPAKMQSTDIWDLRDKISNRQS